MLHYQYTYKTKSILSDNLDINDEAGNPAFFITAHGILDRHYKIRHHSSDEILWTCKQSGIFSSSKYVIEKPEHGAKYKIIPKGVLSENYTANFAGVEIKWKPKSFLNYDLIASEAESKEKILEMSDKAILREKGVINIDLSTFESEKAKHKKLMDQLSTVHQGWDSENIKLDLLAFLLITTYGLYRHVSDGSGD